MKILCLELKFETCDSSVLFYSPDMFLCISMGMFVNLRVLGYKVKFYKMGAHFNNASILI